MIEQHSYSGDYTNRYKFNGKELDEETGFYYYGARYYNPKFSIWLSTDPLAEMFPNWNPYNYTMQNPINLTDPTGMSPEGDPVNPPKDAKEGQTHSEHRNSTTFSYTYECGSWTETDAIIDTVDITGGGKKSNVFTDAINTFGAALFGLPPDATDRYEGVACTGRYSPGKSGLVALSVVGLPVALLGAAEIGVASLLYTAPESYSAYFGKAGLDFTTEMIANKGNIGDVNAISVIGAGFGADALSSPFSLSYNRGFERKSFEQSLINYGANKFNGGIQNGVKYLGTNAIFKSGFGKVYTNALSIGIQSAIKNQTSELIDKPK